VHLERVFIDGVRNLCQQRIELAAGANVFFGANGSGKTSILEAISLVATGRSFRTHSAKPLIHHGDEHCLVQIKLARSGRLHNLGIRRHRAGGAELRIDGAAASSFAGLAALLPIVLVDTDSIELITGTPEARRRYLDTILFHVEHQFLEVWRRYQRVLRQRNAGLRRGTLAEDDIWLTELARVGETLAALRAVAVASLAPVFAEIAGRLSGALNGATLTLRRGWSSELDLLGALNAAAASDRKQGFTHVGPHRADIRILVDGRAAADVLSRGQLKLATLALKLAQGRMLSGVNGVVPVYLVDDIAAELDEDHARQACS